MSLRVQLLIESSLGSWVGLALILFVGYNGEEIWIYTPLGSFDAHDSLTFFGNDRPGHFLPSGWLCDSAFLKCYSLILEIGKLVFCREDGPVDLGDFSWFLAYNTDSGETTSKPGLLAHSLRGTDSSAQPLCTWAPGQRPRSQSPDHGHHRIQRCSRTGAQGSGDEGRVGRWGVLISVKERSRWGIVWEQRLQIFKDIMQPMQMSIDSARWRDFFARWLGRRPLVCWRCVGVFKIRRLEKELGSVRPVKAKNVILRYQKRLKRKQMKTCIWFRRQNSKLSKQSCFQSLSVSSKPVGVGWSERPTTSRVRWRMGRRHGSDWINRKGCGCGSIASRYPFLGHPTVVYVKRYQKNVLSEYLGPWLTGLSHDPARTLEDRLHVVLGHGKTQKSLEPSKNHHKQQN